MNKFISLLRQKFARLHGRLLLAGFLLGPLPHNVGSRLRVHLLRQLGFRGISPRAIISSLPIITGRGDIYERLKIGDVCYLNVECYLNLDADITIGNFVAFGQQVMIFTESHAIGIPEYRSGELGAQPVKIGNGCWLGARVIILPGVTIGDGAVVGAGAIVTKDVPPHTVVAGVPAKVIRELEH